MDAVNIELLTEKKLLLPKVENGTLAIYQVFDFESLIRSPFGVLEPDPKNARLISSSALSCILVPGLGFDHNNRRLGFGKGHYDRFLQRNSFLKIGVGFSEQLIFELPFEAHDVSLDKLVLG